MDDKPKKYGRYPNWIHLLLLIFTLCLPFSISTRAHAHKVYLYAWVEGDRIYTESYFSGKKKAVGGIIKVYDPEGNKLLEGQPDEQGEFSFAIPQKTDLKIVLEASMGHRTGYLLSMDEFLDPKEGPTPSAEKSTTPDTSLPAGAVNTEQIRQVLENVLDTRLQPIARALAKIQQERGPGFTEVIGGIGYIFGLMGIVLYFKGGKKV